MSCMVGPIDSYARIVVFCIGFVTELGTNRACSRIQSCCQYVEQLLVFSQRGSFFLVFWGGMVPCFDVM